MELVLLTLLVKCLTLFVTSAALVGWLWRQF
jgi:hypothetical protein